METYTCANCLKSFEAYKRKNEGKRYCSRECWLEKGASAPKHKVRSDKGAKRSEHVEVECPGCGTLFEKRKSDLKKNKNVYCDKDCWAKNGATLTKGGRPRKRPGGPGMPPRPSPETLEANERWPIKSWFNDNGYILLYMPDCPYAPKSTGRIHEHRLVMSMREGRKLERSEHVDHINQIRDDNRFENLQILTPSAHAKKTIRENQLEWKRLADAAKSMGMSVEEALEKLTN